MSNLFTVLTIICIVGICSPALLAKVIKKQLKRTHYVIATVVCLILVGATAPKEDKALTAAAPASTAKSSAAPVATVDPEKAKAESDAKAKAEADKKTQEEAAAKAKAEADAKASFENQDVTPDTVKAALFKAKGFNVTKVDDKNLKKIDTDGKKITIHMNPGTVWDEKDFVREAGGTLVGFSEVLFKNTKVEEVTLSFYTTFTDQYGKENEKKGVTIAWSRETSDKVAYDKFQDMIVSDISRPYAIADRYFIYGAIYTPMRNSDKLKFNGLSASKKPLESDLPE